MDTFDVIIDKVNEASTICILTHENPDGDAIGSSLAIYGYIQENFANKNVTVLMKDLDNNNYNFIKLVDVVKSDAEQEKFDLVIAMDCGSKDRLYIYEDIFDKALETIQIDHHITNTNYAKTNFVDFKSSTCEVIYTEFNKRQFKDNIDILNCIYTGISTDTGSFQHSNVTASTFETAKCLVEKGVDTSYIAGELYSRTSIERLKAISYIIENMEMYEENKIAFAYISQDTMTRLNISNEAAGYLITYLRIIDTVDVAMLAREKEDGTIKVSMRSRDKVNVAKLCEKYGGGGHIKAAGCSFNDKNVDYKQLLINEIASLI